MSADAADDTKPAGPKPPKRAGRQSRIVRLRVVEVATDYPEDVQRPRVRGDCKDGPRPCPFVSCRMHLYLDPVAPNKRGRGKERFPGIQFNFPKIEVWEMRESCALDLADQDGMVHEDIASALNISKQGAQQTIDKASVRLAQKDAARRLLVLAQEDPIRRYGK